jgi:hypothetical protein
MNERMMVHGFWAIALAATLGIALSPRVASAQPAATSGQARPQPSPAEAAEPAPGTPAPEPAAGPTPPRAFDESQAAPAAPYPPPPGTLGPGTPEYRLAKPVLGAPVVTLRADNPRARLQQKELRWEDVCTMPCRRAVDPSGVYRVAGGTIKPSVTFQMPRPQGNVLVDAHVGSVVKYWVGFGLALGGIATALGGGLVLAASDSQSSSDTIANDAASSRRVIGWTYVVTGAIMALVGLPLCLSNTTSVEVH